jgi:hypothetical protein
VVFGIYRSQYDYQSAFIVSAGNMQCMAELCQEIEILCQTYDEKVK